MLHQRLLFAQWRETLDFAMRFGTGRLASAVEGGRAAAAFRDNGFRLEGPLRSFRRAQPLHATTARHRQAEVNALRAKAALWCIAKYSVAGLAILFALGLIALGIGLVATYEAPKSFEARHLRNARPAVIDNEGELVGAAPGFRRMGAVASEVPDDESRMTALAVHDVPPVWWDVAIALEDKRFGKFGWVYGIDLFALPNLLLGRRGGSTLAMQLVGNLSGDKARQNDERGSLASRVKRKLRELSSTPSLVASTVTR